MALRPLPGCSGMLIAIHETREGDIAVWRGKPSQHPRRAATHVNWHEARAFCEWLTQRERASGHLSPHSRYRLPTDHEWSCAAGIAGREDARLTPEQKDRHLADTQPWPPPQGIANYAGDETGILNGCDPIPGFRDHDAYIADALAYFDTRLGLCSLRGNVWEWCEDEFRPGSGWRVLRGASWRNTRPDTLNLSHRTHDPGTYRSDTVGFRVALEQGN